MMSIVLQNMLGPRVGPATRTGSLLSRAVSVVKHNPKVQEYGMLIPLSLGLTGLKVLMHGKAYEHEGFTPEDRRLLYVQEATRQTISTALWLATLCLSYEVVVKRAFPNMSRMGQILVSNLVSQLPDTFVRPFVTAKASKWILNQMNATLPATSIRLPQPTPSAGNTRSAIPPVARSVGDAPGFAALTAPYNLRRPISPTAMGSFFRPAQLLGGNPWVTPSMALPAWGGMYGFMR